MRGLPSVTLCDRSFLQQRNGGYIMKRLAKRGWGRYGWLLLLLTVVALVMRILGCFWGFPLQLHPDEPATVDYAIEMLSRHSWMAQSFDRPDHFEIKCDAILFTLVSWLVYHQSAYVAFQSHAPVFYLVARFFTALFGTALIPMTALFTQSLLKGHDRRYKKTAALVAACGVGFLPVFMRYSTLATPDVILCFFALIFTWMIQQYLETGRNKFIYWAAVVIGICITIKYNGAILCLPLALAVIYRSVRERRFKDILQLGVGSVLLVIGTMLVIAPNLFLDYKVVFANIVREARPNHLGADGLSFSGNLKFYLLDIADAFGIVTLPLALWGAVCILRERKQGSLCLLTGLIYWICMSVLKLHWSRWGIPMYPFYLILVGVALADLAQRASALTKGRRVASGVVAAFTLALLCNAFLYGLCDTKALLVPDSRTLALSDFERMGITAENSIYEGYTPFDPAGYLDKTDAFRETENGIEPTQDNEGKAYFIMSDSFYGRYLAEPQRYADKIAVYKSIARKYPVMYKLAPNGDRKASKWILSNILDCLDYLRQHITCGGSTITVYALRQ